MSVLSPCGVVALAASDLVGAAPFAAAASAVAPFVSVSLAAAPLLLLPPLSLLPPLVTPLLQLMPAGRAPQELEVALLGGGCVRDEVIRVN